MISYFSGARTILLSSGSKSNYSEEWMLIGFPTFLTVTLSSSHTVYTDDSPSVYEHKFSEMKVKSRVQGKPYIKDINFLKLVLNLSIPAFLTFFIFKIKKRISKGSILKLIQSIYKYLKDAIGYCFES